MNALVSMLATVIKFVFRAVFKIIFISLFTQLVRLCTSFRMAYDTILALIAVIIIATITSNKYRQKAYAIIIKLLIVK